MAITTVIFFLLGWTVQGAILIFLGIILLVYHGAGKWFGRYTQAEEKEKARERLENLVESFEIYRIIARQAVSLGGICSGYGEIFKRIEKIKGIKERNPDIEVPDLVELEEEFIREKDRRILKFVLKETELMMFMAKKMEDSSEKLKKADEAMKLLVDGRRELREKNHKQLTDREVEVKVFLHNLQQKNSEEQAE